MKVLLLEYMVIMVVCLFERNGPRTLYWFGAVLLQISVLWGMR